MKIDIGKREMGGFRYIKVKDSSEVSPLLTKEGTWILAGGTDLLVNIKKGLLEPEVVIDLKGIEKTHKISFDGKLIVGASTTLNDILEFKYTKEFYPGLYKACKSIATYQLRNRATLVGNLCNASPAADTAPILLTLDATLVVMGKDGIKEMPLSKFFVNVKKNALKKGEFVFSVKIPKPVKGDIQTFFKRGRICGADLSIVNIAGVYNPKGKLRIGIGSAATTPLLFIFDDLVRNEKDVNRLKKEIIKQVMNRIDPISDVRASKEYRIEMILHYLNKIIDDYVNESCGGCINATYNT